MGIGVVAATAVGSNDPTELILASGLPSVALLVLALATVTTNFVNLYLSALALRTLWPGFPPRLAVVLLGTVGTLLSVVDERLLERYAGFMGLLATLLLPIVAIALVHFFWLPRRRSGADRGALLNTTRPGMRPAGLAAWGAGALVYQVVVRTHPEWGATALTLIVAACVYAMFSRRATNPCKLGSSPGSSR
jgi:purine-cytosine permease-like protein